MDGGIMCDYGVLGPALARPIAAHLPSTRQREWTVLSTLLNSPNEAVQITDIVDATWERNAPRTCREQVRNACSRVHTTLRKFDPQTEITSVRDAYLLAIDPSRVDHISFSDSIRVADGLRGRGEWHPAAALYRRALDLWRGPVLGGQIPQVLMPMAARLSELRLQTADDYYECVIKTGKSSTVLADLLAHVHGNPLRERSVALLMMALHGSGRTVEALHAFRQLQHRLDDELGLAPCREVQQIHRAILVANLDDSRDEQPGLDLRTTAVTHDAIDRIERGLVQLSNAVVKIQTVLDALTHTPALTAVAGVTCQPHDTGSHAMGTRPSAGPRPIRTRTRTSSQ